VESDLGREEEGDGGGKGKRGRPFEKKERQQRSKPGFGKGQERLLKTPSTVPLGKETEERTAARKREGSTR